LGGVKKIISALLYSNADIDDIKIFISLFSIDYENQDNLENYIDILIKECSENPESFLKDLNSIIELETSKKDILLEEKEKISSDINALQEKYKNNISEATKLKEIFNKNIGENSKLEKEIQQKLIKHREIVKNIEKELQDVKRLKNDLEVKNKKETQTKNDEQNKLSNKLKDIGKKLLEFESNITNLTDAVNSKQDLLKDIKEK